MVSLKGIDRPVTSKRAPSITAESSGSTKMLTFEGRLETNGSPIDRFSTLCRTPRTWSSSSTRPSTSWMLLIAKCVPPASSSGPEASRSITSVQLLRSLSSNTRRNCGAASLISLSTGPPRISDSSSRLAWNCSKPASSRSDPVGRTWKPPISSVRVNGLIATRSILTSRFNNSASWISPCQRNSAGAARNPRSA